RLRTRVVSRSRTSRYIPPRSVTAPWPIPERYRRRYRLYKRLDGHRQRQAEPGLRVSPPGTQLKPGGGELARYPVPPELRGDLRPHRCIRGKRDAEADRLEQHGLIDSGSEPHLDPLGLGIPDRDVIKLVDVEVAVELRVEHTQDVLVELRRHPSGIVVGRD